jgi:hypothetical protein
MSSSRIIYDDDCKKVRLAQNVMPGNYQLFEFTGINPKKCKPNRLPRNSVNESRNAILADRAVIERHLGNHHIPLNCNNETNQDWKDKKSVLDNDPTCSNFENGPDEYSRLSHPVSDYRGINTLKNTITPYLHVNPQVSIAGKMQPIPVSTRDIARKHAAKKNANTLKARVNE